MKAEDQQLAEVVVTEGSPLWNPTLSGLRFADRYGLITVAFHRAGQHLNRVRNEIGDVRLIAGDVLQVQGPREQISSLEREEDILFLRIGVPLVRVMWVTLAWLLPTTYGLD